MRAFSRRLISFIVQCVVVLSLTLGLSFSAGHSLAQDATPEVPTPSDPPTVVATDIPTELPTVVPTDAPTDVPTSVPPQQATDVPTEVSTEQVTAAPTDATAAPTETVPQVSATPDTSKYFNANFQDGSTSGWQLTAGWAITDDASNAVLSANTPNEVATLTAITWPYYTLSFKVRGSIQLTMAAGGSNFQVKVDANGAAALYKDNVLLGQSEGATPTDATVEPSANWHTVNLLAPGNLLAVKVDNYAPISTTDPVLVGMGPLIFITSPDNTAPVAFDDVNIERLDAPPPTPAVEPTNAGVVPIPPPTNMTAEPTTEAMAEPTVEVTQEATIEATVEATAEATVEATIEATVEATAEATTEPSGLSEAARTKLPPSLVDILDRYASGDVAGAQTAAEDYFVTVDNQQRISVTVWTASEQDAAQTAGEITTAGGIITDAFSIRVQASVTMEGLLKLANSAQVTSIEVPPKAVSTSDMQAPSPAGYGTGFGTEISEGVDVSGAAAWQSAGINGSGVGIAVIDTGFGATTIATTTAPISATGEYACLINNTVSGQILDPSDGMHGKYMIQVLCDMAPAAKVYMYKATDAPTLKNAIDQAKLNAAIKVIVISMDLGSSVSPGDGTDGGATYGLNGLYTSLTAARNAGKIVIASAGNNTGRYVTLDYQNTITTVPMTVYAGDTIHVSWNDWNSNNQNIGLTIAGSGITTTTFDTGTSPRSGAPRATITIPPANCTTSSGCSINLSMNTTNGGTTPLVVQVQVAGQGTINTAGVTGSSVLSTTGNLARPADSPDVIAVGAVCNNNYMLQQTPPGTAQLPLGSIQLKRDLFSSQGPIFGTGGTLPTPSSSYTRDQVKPDLMGISHISVDVGNRINDNDIIINPDRANPQSPVECDAIGDNVRGFNGTSAAAASVAGMAALLVSSSNPSMAASFKGTTGAAVDAIQNYLQTHTIDDTTSASTAVGYDMLYGAGLTVLGSPTYNLNLITTPTNGPNQLPQSCAANQPLYVGLANPGSSQDGTLTNPYISIGEAMTKAANNQCVVVLPGEYVAPVAAQASTNTPAVISYESATSFAATSSNLWSVFLPPISIFSNGVVADGFTALSAVTMPISTGQIRNPPLYLYSANNAAVQNNFFVGYIFPGTLTKSTGTHLNTNTFSGFAIPSTSQTISVPVDSSAILKIKESTGVVLASNYFVANSIGKNTGTVSDWLPALVGIRYSSVDLFYNRFSLNTTSTIVGIDRWQGDPGASLEQTGEIRFFSNVINDNTINGPVVHLYAGLNMRFVNNTVVNNVMNGNGSNNLDPSGGNTAALYDGYFIFGALNVPALTFNNIDSKFEIHNNLFYNNLNTAGTVRPLLLETADNAINIGCDAIGSGAPARNNWFDAFIGSDRLANTRGGECSAGGKVTNSIDETLSASSFFGTAVDSVNPYRLRPTDPSITTLKSGINTGDNQALIDMFTDPGYLSQVDLRGADRVVVGGNPNPTYGSAPAVVDIGAYELGTPNPPTALAASDSFAEDSKTSVIYKLTASGGYTQVFAITSQPTEYDTNPNNACGGQPLLFTAPDTVTYCPPANFHTRYGAGDTHIPVTIGFSVEDPVFRPGQISTSSISITITPVNDGTPTAASFNLLSDYVTPITQQLNPIYQLGNFFVSGTGGSVDYPYTFAYDTQTTATTDNANLLKSCTACPSTTQVLQDAFTAANSNGGKLIINPVAGQKGYVTFNYKVTDRDGDSGTGTVTLVIQPTLAQEGTHDDAGFNFAYNGTGWTSSFDSTAYNNSLHSTTTGTDSFEIAFSGSVVRFNLRGSPVANAGLNMAFELNLALGGLPRYQSYAATKTTLGANFSCVNNLTSSAPDGSSNISNYSATGALYSVTCSGFPTGQAHSIKITNNLNGPALTLDSSDISAGVMTAGKSYQETSANLTYTGVWTQNITPSALGGSRRYSNDPNGKISFNVDSTVGRLVIYHTTYLSSIYGSMQVYVGGVLKATIDNTSAAFLFGQPYVVNFTPANQTVEIRNVGSTYSDLDQIDALPVAQTLGIGSYQETYPDLTYTGTWTSYVGAGPLGGSVRYTNLPSANVKFKIDGTVGRIIIYRTTYSIYGSTEIYLDNQTTPSATINNITATYLFAQPYEFDVTPGNHTIELRNVGSTYSSLDQIDLLAPLQPLNTTIGTYQETDTNLVYSGTWTSNVTPVALGGSRIYTNDPNGSVSFKINSTVSRIVVYRTTYLAGIYGSMQVFLDSSTTPIATIDNTSSAFLFQQPYLVSIASPGNHTVTIKNVGSTYSDIDQITVLGATPYLGLGSYQENDFNLTYNGTWATNVTTSALGGARVYTNQNNASVSFKINNTVSRVVVYRTTYLAGVYGSMQVFLDTNTTPIATINNTSGGFAFQQPYTITIPVPGDHTVTIKNVGTTYSDIDQISLVGSPQVLTPGTYQETNIDLTYSGSWTPNATSSALGGNRIYTNDPNGNVSFNIDSSTKRIIIYRSTYLSSIYGSMQVKAGSTVIATINNTSAAFLFGQPHMVTIPTPGNIKITLQNVGSTYSDLDQIVLLDSAQTLTESPGVYQENDPNLTYSGLWNDQANGSALYGSRRYTNDPNGSVSFSVGTNVTRMVIYRTTYAAGIYGSMQVFLDGSGTASATINNTSTDFLYGQPAAVINMASGGHTVKIQNVGSTYSDIDQIVLLTGGTSLSASATGSSYQENYPDLTYSGVWTNQSTPSVLGNSRRYTNDPNGKVSFNVDSSVGRIVIYHTTYLAGVYGSMQVYVNGALQATIDNTSPAFVFGLPYTLTITPAISPATQTVEIRNVGSTYSDIDQIDLLPPAQTLSLGSYQETNVNLTYSGLWTQNVTPVALGGARRYTNDSTAKVSFNIDNSVGRIVIYRSTYLTGVYGSMQVYVGGVLKATISNTSSAFLFQQPYTVIVTPGNQTVEIRNVGSTYSDIDQITLLAPRNRLTLGTYQETDTNLTYNGLWTPNSTLSALGGSRIYTNDPNGVVSFDVDNTVSRLVIYHSTYLTGLYGSMQVYANGVLQTTIDNTSSAFLFQQPYVVTLTPANQTIEIRNVGSTYSDIDQITLLGTRTRLSATPGNFQSYQETDLNLTYTGIWTQQAVSAAFGGARRYTNDPTAKVSFDIDPSVSRIIIYRTTYLTGVYGSMQIYVGGTLQTTIDNTSTAFLFGQPFFLNVTPGNQTVEIRNVGSTYSDIDQIMLLGNPQTVSTAQLYEENDPALSYTGQWTSVSGNGPSGNAAYYTYQPGASVTFHFTGRGFSLYRMLANGAGTFSVNVDGNVQNFNNSASATQWQRSLDFGPLANTAHTVVITNTSPTSANFLYFDAIRVVDITAPLTVGQYQNTYAGLTYTGTWPVDSAGGLSAGAATYTTAVNDQLSFSFTGTGFGIMTDNIPTGANMQICYTISGGSAVCNTYSTAANPTQLNVGYDFYNLKQGTYTVTVKHSGTAGQGLYIDRVFILDTPSTTLQAGVHEENDPGIVYSPSELWTSYSSTSYSGGTATTTTQKGAVMQLRFNGGTLVVYQVAAPGIASNINLCLRLTDTAGNPTSLCGTYSERSTTASFVAPVAFYGFGTGTHDVIIENPAQGVQFNIDKILVN